MQNPNPTIHKVAQITREEENKEYQPIDALEIFDLIRHIKDPEHPNSLEQLKVVTYDQITIDHDNKVITIQFTPTITHCSMATLIGLTLRVQLQRSISRAWKVDIFVKEGSHDQEADLNKQLNDKERVLAAIENPKLLKVVNDCIGTVF